MELKIKRLLHGADLPLPEYATAQSAGLDLRAAVEKTVHILPGERQSVPTGLAIGLPEGFEAQIRPRSGLALRQGITLLNSPGTIDADYRGEIILIVINHGQHKVEINRGDRIAQMVITPVVQAVLRESDNLDQTKRGSGGFGSTGMG